MSEPTDQRQTEIERKLAEQAQYLDRPATGVGTPEVQSQNTSWSQQPPLNNEWQQPVNNWQSTPSDGNWSNAQPPPAFVPQQGEFQAYAPPVAPNPPGLLERWRAKGGFLGTLAAILMFVAKVGGPILLLLSKLKFLLIAAKFLLAFGSMFLAMWLESKAFGWPLAVGIVLLIAIHECGHALAAKSRGHKTGIMVFIPFMGAFVTTDRYGKSLEEDAFIGIMGPVVGSAASIACMAAYIPTGNPFWIVLGQWGCFINLFNLLPTPPLDGGWIAPLFSPKLLLFGAVIAVFVGFRNPLIWHLLVASIPRILAAWKADPATQPYYRVPTAVKWKYGLTYLGLAGLLALASSHHVPAMIQ